MKPAKPPRPIITEPSLLVCHEKHGKVYFHVTDEDNLFRIALDIVCKRLKAGYWYNDPKEYVPKNPGMTEEQVHALPEGPIRSTAMKQLAAYKAELEEYNSLKESWDYLQKAVREKNGRAAWQVLRDHNDGEYQRVTIEGYCTEYYD